MAVILLTNFHECPSMPEFHLQLQELNVIVHHQELQSQLPLALIHRIRIPEMPGPPKCAQGTSARALVGACNMMLQIGEHIFTRGEKEPQCRSSSVGRAVLLLQVGPEESQRFVQQAHAVSELSCGSLDAAKPRGQGAKIVNQRRSARGYCGAHGDEGDDRYGVHLGW